MKLDYPLPSHAAYIWASGPKVTLTFPGYESAESRRFNSVVLDPAETIKCKCGCLLQSPTLLTLWEILKSRTRAEGPEARKIGSPATPTRHQVAEYLRKNRARRARPGQRSESRADRTLRELGITPQQAQELLASLEQPTKE